METHWDRSANGGSIRSYDQAVTDFGVSPEGLGTELDHWMPGNTPAGVRSALNLGFAVTTGLMDAVVLGVVKSLPIVGSLARSEEHTV